MSLRFSRVRSTPRGFHAADGVNLGGGDGLLVSDDGQRLQGRHRQRSGGPNPPQQIAQVLAQFGLGGDLVAAVGSTNYRESPHAGSASYGAFLQERMRQTT